MTNSGLVVRRSSIDGRGCFAARSFARGRRVAELEGERIPVSEVRRRAAGKRRIRICEIDETTAIDTTVGGDATAYINHSCDPNLSMRVLRGHALFFAKRDIAAGDELTLDYEESLHTRRKRCRCGAANCRGRINRSAA